MPSLPSPTQYYHYHDDGNIPITILVFSFGFKVYFSFRSFSFMFACDRFQPCFTEICHFLPRLTGFWHALKKNIACCVWIAVINIINKHITSTLWNTESMNMMYMKLYKPTWTKISLTWENGDDGKESVSNSFVSHGHAFTMW